MRILDFPTAISKNFKSYRNIYTVSPSQSLYDDIGEPEDSEAFSELEALTSGIAHTEVKKNRVFQYCENEDSFACFGDMPWQCSRFTSGKKFGVWCGALEENTSLFEVIYHLKIGTKEFFKNPKNLDKSYIIDRAFYTAEVSATKLIDMRDYSDQGILVSENYHACNEIGELALDSKVDAFFTPSARVPQGICTPIFNREIIQEKFLKYIKIEINRNFEVFLNEDKTALNLP